MLHRCVFEACLVIPFIISASEAHQVKIIETGHVQDCRQADFHCKPKNILVDFAFVWAALIWVYACLFLYHTLQTRAQLRAQSYVRHRAPNILLQLQVGCAAGCQYSLHAA